MKDFYDIYIFLTKFRDEININDFKIQKNTVHNLSWTWEGYNYCCTFGRRGNKQESCYEKTPQGCRIHNQEHQQGGYKQQNPRIEHRLLCIWRAGGKVTARDIRGHDDTSPRKTCNGWQKGRRPLPTSWIQKKEEEGCIIWDGRLKAYSPLPLEYYLVDVAGDLSELLVVKICKFIHHKLEKLIGP